MLNAEFGFTVDVCATPANAKCERFFTPEMNGLTMQWTGVCWMNPPYSGGRAIALWVRKAYESAQDGATVVCLLPSKTDTKWWHDYCLSGEIRFLRGRLTFEGQPYRASFPSVVVVFK